jgi:hypothetical protein
MTGSEAGVPGPVVLGSFRVTPVHRLCLRIEYDPERRFIDAPSTFAINRLSLCPAAVERSGDEVVVDTGRIRLRCRDDGRPPHAGNLHAQFTDGAWHGEWRPGLIDRENLGGALPTLDGVLGPTATEPGLLSRSGWQVIDDSRRPLIAEGWWQGRPEQALDFYLFGYGRDFRGALHALTCIAGPVPLPRRYALGSWYSRYWPYTSSDYRRIVQEYRQHGWPLDVLVLDMDWHRAGWTGWSWNRELLPDAEQLLSWLHQQGLAVTLNVHPADGVGPHEDAYPDFMRALGKDPASGVTIPFNPWDRAMMTALLQTVHGPLEAAGVDFWWLDWQQVIHGLPALHAENILFWMNRAYFQHTAREGKRGMSFSRWGGWGDHRHPIHFSGDVHTGWDALAFTVAFTVSSGNAGLFFWSHDIGGHLGRRDDECYARWVQFGAFSACFRLHSMKAADLDRRPWTYGPAAQRSARIAIDLRTQLFPYLYSSAAESSRDAVPLLRPMYLDHPHEGPAYEVPHQYLLGASLLVAPVVTVGMGEGRVAEQAVWFPPGAPWYHLLSGECYQGGQTRLVLSDLDELPVFVRGGDVLPLQAISARMAGPPAPALVLRVYPGAEGSSQRTELYEDDGIGDPASTGCVQTLLRYERRGELVRMTIGPARVQGVGFPGLPAERSYVLELAGTERGGHAQWDGRTVRMDYDEQRAINRAEVGPVALGSAIVFECRAAAMDPARFSAAAHARRLTGARADGGREPGRLQLLAQRVGAAVSLDTSTSAPGRAVFLFDERDHNPGEPVPYRIVDEWGEGPVKQLVRREGVVLPRPGAPARLTDADWPALDAEERELDKRRFIEMELDVNVDVAGARRAPLRRLITESRGVPLRSWAVVGGDRIVRADPTGIVRVEAREPVRLATRFYSAGPQEVFFIVSADGPVQAWLGERPLQLRAGRPLRLAHTLVGQWPVPHGNHRLWLVVEPAQGQSSIAFGVRLKAHKVLVEQDPDGPPVWPFDG